MDRPLSPDEAALWARVLETVKPMRVAPGPVEKAMPARSASAGRERPAVPPRTVPAAGNEGAGAGGGPSAESLFRTLLDLGVGGKISARPAGVRLHPGPMSEAAGTKKGAQNTLDGSWDRKLSRGLISPDCSIDLHGHNLSTAYATLDGALERSIRLGDRVVLLVTGRPPKAESERPHARGAIRAAVGDWLRDRAMPRRSRRYEPHIPAWRCRPHCTSSSGASAQSDFVNLLRADSRRIGVPGRSAGAMSIAMEGVSLKSRAISFATSAGAVAFILAVVATSNGHVGIDNVGRAIIPAIVCAVMCWASVEQAISTTAGAIDSAVSRLTRAANGDLESDIPPEIGECVPELATAMHGLFQQLNANLQGVQRLAMFDSVTSLPNRTNFRRSCERRLGICRTTTARRCSSSTWTDSRPSTTRWATQWATCCSAWSPTGCVRWPSGSAPPAHSRRR